MILDEFIEVTISSTTIKYYMDKGYDIPKIKNNRGKIVTPKGTKIFIHTKDLMKYSGVYVNAECDCCKKKYKITMENYTKTNHDGKIYCRACSKKIFNSGTMHPFYNTNISDEDRKRTRSYEEYSTFIRSVLKRDGYHCKYCGSSQNIEVHHLDGYNWCIDRRTDVTNGITLCHNCHFNFHSKYGVGNNTKEQFFKWSKNVEINLNSCNFKLSPTKQVYCYEEKRIYTSVYEFAREHNLKYTGHLYKICNHNVRYKTVNGLHLFWRDEYFNMTEEDLKNFLSKKAIRHNRKSLICLNTNQKYDSINEASKSLGLNKNSISNCCNHRQNYVYTKNNEKLKFEFI